MPKIRILFADDQIPWNDPHRDESVFAGLFAVALAFARFDAKPGETVKVFGIAIYDKAK